MDEDADARVGEFLQSRGNVLQFSLAILWQQAPDHLVAAAADELGAVVATRNTRHDRNRIRRDEPLRPMSHLRRAGLICFRCRDEFALQRIEALLEAIGQEYDRCRAL
jgi:hypothetical protein